MKTKSLNIGMLVPDINSYYYAAIVKGVADNLKAHNHNLILSSSFDDPKLEKSSIKSFIANKCDGVIVISIMMMKKILIILKITALRLLFATTSLMGITPRLSMTITQVPTNYLITWCKKGVVVSVGSVVIPCLL